jgi:iron complex outermembrane recepter protein
MQASVFAQEGILTGRVHSGEEDLRGATVKIGSQITFTNNKGEFSFLLKPGIYTVIITHAGYEAIKQQVEVGAGKRQTIDVIMVATEQMGEVVLLGTRAAVQRNNLNTPVPADVFSANKLLQTGQVSLTQMLNFSAPSFNASREILNETVTLRGLDPDHVLLLLNGRRYHNMAFLFQGGLKGQLGRGSVGNDLNSIPFSAIDKIEILRDGASAQYGSDAIGGVINIRLKEDIHAGFARLHLGENYKGDGEKFTFGLNQGIALKKRGLLSASRGFLNVSGDFKYQLPTYRGGIYKGSVYYDETRYPISQRDSIIALDNQKIIEKNFDRKKVIDNVGNLQISNGGALVNGGYPVTRTTDVFWTAAFNSRVVSREASYRFPKNQNQVNIVLYPDGFEPLTKSVTNDVSTIVGFKGLFTNNWHWNISNSYGSNLLRSWIWNTNNASQSFMGKEAPTIFNTGRQIYSQLTNDFNITKNFLHPFSYIQSLNTAWGTEWRTEKFRTMEGEEASWQNYDPTGRTQGGSQGNAGIRPADAVNRTRNVFGSYFDVESDLTRRFLIDVATRYEYYSDFGGNLAAKIASRYKVSDRFSLRASANNGFRAPSMQQRFLSTTQTAFRIIGGIRIPSMRGTFPNDHEVAKALGIPSLKAEKSLNISGGLTARLSPHLNATADIYWIRIKNRIVLSGAFDRANHIDSILSTYPALSQIDQLQFFSNAINTRTYGADIVLNGNWNIQKAQLGLTVAANFTRTGVFGVIQTASNLPADSLNTNTLFKRSDRGSVEKGQPASKINFHISYNNRKIGLDVNTTRFGKTAVLNDSTSRLDEFLSPKILTDVSFHFMATTFMTLTVGANNIFNVYPDALKHPENTNQGTFIYSPEASPFAFNGGYYFIGMTFKW